MNIGEIIKVLETASPNENLNIKDISEYVLNALDKEDNVEHFKVLCHQVVRTLLEYPEYVEMEHSIHMNRLRFSILIEFNEHTSNSDLITFFKRVIDQTETVWENCGLVPVVVRRNLFEKAITFYIE